MFRMSQARFAAQMGLKLLVATTGPLQGLWDRPGLTHEFCNRQAIAILRQDGFGRCADTFERQLAALNAGVYWADEGCKNVGHYLDLKADKGLWRFPSATVEFRRYFGQALYHARRNTWYEAAFFLGAAAHLVQDLCVPHHATAKVFSGHQQYETWVEKRRANYLVDRGGIYAAGHPSHELLLKNARLAAEFLDQVDNRATSGSYHQATGILLPQAQRTTAGLFYQFYAAVGAIGIAA
ncbi:MAG TPA: zinc dependent phospholipase C family protein [Selenomonadales bacterium]|nr:zinc dependent phospholipase C family protein [Selenomonadales bacterium]